MANNKLYGYTPDPSKEANGNRLDKLNPYEFKKGMDYELVNMGIARLAESTEDERQKATETVLKNLQEHGGYYSSLIDYETKYRNVAEGQTKPSFKAYLKEMEDHHMIEVDKKYSNDKMTEPKYKKEDYTTQFKTDKMGSFKLKALKEAIRAEIKNHLQEADNSCSCKFTYADGSAGSISVGIPNQCGYDNACDSGCCSKFLPDGATYAGRTATVSNMVRSRRNEEAGGDDCDCPPNHGGRKSGLGCGGSGCYPLGGKKSEKAKKLRKEIESYLQEIKGNDFEDKEPTTKQIKGIDKSIGDAKEALALAMKKVKELAPDIKKLAKETNDKIKKNPAGKVDYLKTYTTNPDVKDFIKLRKMLKSADLL